MKPGDIGAEPGAEAQEEANKANEEEKENKEGEGTGQAPPEGGSGTEGEGEEAKSPESAKSDANNKRINDLTSLWHKEQAENVRLRQENKGGQQPPTAPQGGDDTPYYLKEGWKPEEYKDLGQALHQASKDGAAAAIREMEQRGSQRDTVKADVEAVIKQIKSVDDEFDERDFYDYADKHNFNLQNPRDLQSVYTSYIEVRDARKAGEKQGKENKEERNKDKINKPGGQGGGGESKGTTWQSMRGKSIADVARDALNRRK